MVMVITIVVMTMLVMVVLVVMMMVLTGHPRFHTQPPTSNRLSGRQWNRGAS